MLDGILLELSIIVHVINAGKATAQHLSTTLCLSQVREQHKQNFRQWEIISLFSYYKFGIDVVSGESGQLEIKTSFILHLRWNLNFGQKSHSALRILRCHRMKIHTHNEPHTRTSEKSNFSPYHIGLQL